jgi:hypothetical protein
LVLKVFFNFLVSSYNKSFSADYPRIREVPGAVLKAVQSRSVEVFFPQFLLHGQPLPFARSHAPDTDLSDADMLKRLAAFYGEDRIIRRPHEPLSVSAALKRFISKGPHSIPWACNTPWQIQAEASPGRNSKQAAK